MVQQPQRDIGQFNTILLIECPTMHDLFSYFTLGVMTYDFWLQTGSQRIEESSPQLSPHDNNTALNNIPSLSIAVSILSVSKILLCLQNKSFISSVWDREGG
jgi:hypothetical protein